MLTISEHKAFLPNLEKSLMLTRFPYAYSVALVKNILKNCLNLSSLKRNNSNHIKASIANYQQH